MTVRDTKNSLWGNGFKTTKVGISRRQFCGDERRAATWDQCYCQSGLKRLKGNDEGAVIKWLLLLFSGV